ncbi:hypothetical protein EIN_255590 [Entamoeba invadens IP1]|uniref:Uncharacterized protein n=1 Tax=Entamoeba invadens IP1 TaxID=370355 RepID=A0A0A1UEW2_ENTIV|nr:hypothetical protein EIN_255590 [Entamoeba invadens IP1]ELP95115.1 hypothetical protein EIN_255590 [Entamoeba invadens IP1]|eukprot:XP_004261886.1 hypothetical protein EIN_255590 [Entamoeba invadens IP1]
MDLASEIRLLCDEINKIGKEESEIILSNTGNKLPRSDSDKEIDKYVKFIQPISLLDVFDELEKLDLVHLKEVVNIVMALAPTTVSVERYFDLIKQLMKLNMPIGNVFQGLKFSSKTQQLYYEII